MGKLYYEAYEERYRAVQSVSEDIFWGHTAEDGELRQYLSEWTGKHGLSGRRVVEFCCGEGGSGVVFSELGCAYQGYDLAPSAVRKAQALLEKFPDASAHVRDLVRDALPASSYDVAFDSMGLHMLVTDSDRNRTGYLAEMEEAGFIVDEFIEMGENRKCVISASIFVHRPGEGENRP